VADTRSEREPTLGRRGDALDGAEAERAPRYDGADASELARRLGVPRVELFARVTSTMDVAHALGAAGAGAGTLVLADEQTAGRGRGGRPWHSAPGAGIWLTLLERPTDVAALEVLSVRVGLSAAAALDRFADGPVRLKWPNDLYVGAGKVAGVLIEARWRDDRPDWVAVGFGLNVAAPAQVPVASGLRQGTSRLPVLAALVRALRAAAAARGALDDAELRSYGERDLARGRVARRPGAGVVLGITAEAELVIAADGGARRFRSGSLELEGDA
jgi:BirA family biotin operon repressor/biotin-[acetyl-CoA-carboxylase] ligase